MIPARVIIVIPTRESKQYIYHRTPAAPNIVHPLSSYQKDPVILCAEKDNVRPHDGSSPELRHADDTLRGVQQ